MTRERKDLAPVSGVEMLQARLSQAAADLAAGRITAQEGNRIVREARRELATIEAALRTAKVAVRLRAR